MPALQASRAAPEGSRWLTLGQACRLLGVDESTLRRWSDNGQVRAFRTPGGHRRFAEEDVQALLAGRGQEGQRYRELGDMAVTRIRRQLTKSPAREASWYTTVDEASRERLRPLGRRLAALAADYLGRRSRRAGLLEDARRLGQEYGRELASSGMPLAQAVEAFIFFRRSLDDATKQASQRHGLAAGDALNACQQVISLADQVLVGLTEAYEAPPAAVPRRRRAAGGRR
jgi:excisionase family DNA binding protein